jgi:hypothetical protein
LLLRYKDEIFLNGEVGLKNVIVRVFIVGAAEEVGSRKEKTPVCKVLHANLS